jgi:HK97 family phage major capsid protein
MEVAEIKKAIEGLGKAWDEHKTTLATRDEEIKKLGKASSDTETKLAKISADLDKFQEVKARLEAIEVAIKRRGTGHDGKPEATEVEVEHRKALNTYLRKCDSKGLDALAERKALSVNSNPDGGYFVNADMSGRIASRVFETSPMRAVASVQNISTDALEGYFDIDEPGAGWESETAAPAETTTPKIGKWRIPTHELRARPKATQKLLEDAEVDVEAWLSRKVADKFARTESTAFVLGDGVNKPRGLLTYAAGTNWGQIEQIASGGVGVITGDALLNLIYAVKEFYRGGSRFIMGRLAQGAIRKLKDTQGAYLWQPGLEMGQPSTLLGFPITEFNDMPSIATGALAIGFGNLAESYQIVDRLGISVLRDPYSSKPYVEFYTRKRVGGDVVNFEAVKLMVVG